MTSTRLVTQQPLPITLANTIAVDRGHVRDSLAEPADLERWVREIAGQIDLSPRPSNIETIASPAAQRLISLRDGIRRLAAEHTHDPRTLGQSPVPDVTTAMTIINNTSGLSSVWPELQWDDSTARRRDVWAGGTYRRCPLHRPRTTDRSTSPPAHNGTCCDHALLPAAPNSSSRTTSDANGARPTAATGHASHVTPNATTANKGAASGQDCRTPSHRSRLGQNLTRARYPGVIRRVRPPPRATPVRIRQRRRRSLISYRERRYPRLRLRTQVARHRVTHWRRRIGIPHAATNRLAQRDRAGRIAAQPSNRWPAAAPPARAMGRMLSNCGPATTCSRRASGPLTLTHTGLHSCGASCRHPQRHWSTTRRRVSRGRHAQSHARTGDET